MTLQDDINRVLAEGYERMAAESGAHTTPLLCDAPRVTVVRHSAYLPVSLDQLVDSGAISEAEARAQGWTPPPRAPWHRRARWRWQERRERAGRKVGGWIAGVDLSERDEDW